MKVTKHRLRKNRFWWARLTVLAALFSALGLVSEANHTVFGFRSIDDGGLSYRKVYGVSCKYGGSYIWWDCGLFPSL